MEINVLTVMMIQRSRREVGCIVFRSLLSILEELTLLILPHGGQKTARRNAWRAAADFHVTAGYRSNAGSKILSVHSQRPRTAVAARR
jgi:hypothetical protein